jgi:hypothetical protein
MTQSGQMDDIDSKILQTKPGLIHYLRPQYYGDYNGRKVHDDLEIMLLESEFP